MCTDHAILSSTSCVTGMMYDVAMAQCIAIYMAVSGESVQDDYPALSVHCWDDMHAPNLILCVAVVCLKCLWFKSYIRLIDLAIPQTSSLVGCTVKNVV